MIFEQWIPLFEEGRILKKEALDRIRDYTSDFIGIRYQRYGNGVIEGFDIRGCPGGILVGRGILKDGEDFYIQREPVTLAYEPENRKTAVVLQRMKEKNGKDFRILRYSLELREPGERRDGEFELGRFCLERGARLRNTEDYKNILDAVTEHNTLNLVHVKAACEGGSGLVPSVLRVYAGDVLKAPGAEPADLAFAMTCLGAAQGGAGLLRAYLLSRCPDADSGRLWENAYCYGLLRQLYMRLAKGRNMGRGFGTGSAKTLID